MIASSGCGWWGRMEETVVFIRFSITIIVIDCCYCYCNVIVWLVGENGGNCSFCQICWTLYCLMFINHCYWLLLVLLYLKPPTDQRVWYCSTISHHVNNLRKTLRKMWQNILFISASPSLDISYFEISPSKCVRKWLNWKRNMIYISIHIYTTP